jgi:hypothetical protein
LAVVTISIFDVSNPKKRDFLLQLHRDSFITMAQPVHSVLFDSNADPNTYYNQQPSSGDNLQFYSSTYGDAYNPSYYGNAPPGPPPSNMQSGNNFDYGRPAGSFWSAFGTGGFDDEPPLLEELGINFQHIRAKVGFLLNIVNIG